MVHRCLSSRTEDESDIATDIVHALESTLDYNVPSADNICCGYFGRIDFLLEASRRLGNASLLREAQKIAQARLQRSEEKALVFQKVEEGLEHR